MSNRRILGFSFVAASVVVFIVLRAAVAWIGDTAGLANMAVGPLNMSDLVAIVITVAIAIGCWKSAKVFGFLTEVVEEVSKVVWPTRQEIRDSTIVVLVFVFVIAGILGSFDLVWAKLTNLILSGSWN
jgi:preprotein translocase SecE subunit